ncbi:MAG: hypothetical protein M4D80_42340 [Myxococcota bacterium]|nr:hypothetical protein [Myxococcota bacterium]
MWPFSTEQHGLWLVLYLLTWAMHAVFIGYVLVGSAYAFVQTVRNADDPISERARDLLPFMLGCGITAGVAPLLFLQLLYQERFYTANLLLGPRWGAVVPALIAGFYALYLAKAAASPRWRKLALATAVGTFLFVAWSWTELHLVMRDQGAWTAMYGAGDRMYGQGDVIPRLLLWLGAMPILFATVSLWLVAPSRRLSAVAIAGHVVVGAAVVWIVARGGSIDTAHGWLYLLLAAVAIELGAWVWLLRSPTSTAATVVTAATTAALLAGAVVREAPRLVLLEPTRPAAQEASGFPVFAVTAVIGVAAIAFIWKTIRTARE